ncbi:Domain of uncharacterised function (DUF2479) [Enterococcus durans]|uniref:BppU family phage baseplate upper protein n=1 Tax=Enterococcus durans TaxID=53345 RepID=UPI000DFF4A0B|nr:BppU family phage baseplate upper protein [Enterococcus durans]STP39317.1 Domain of uncharacterised function (DUF2479) [Enterococcus durans]
MTKWNATLSTTEPFNYIGMIQVRQGNKNSEIMETTITENGLPYDLTGCKVYFESIIGDKYPVQLGTKIIDAKKGKIQYTFDQYSMQMLHRQTADFIIYKDDELIATTQDFSYFVIKAVSKTEGEMGSYWQSVEDLIVDMTNFINENKGDFTAWMNARKDEFDQWRKNQQDTFEAWRKGQESDYLSWFGSIKDILASIDPGGTMLAELMDARVDIQGVRHESISERLLADLNFIYEKIKSQLDLIVHDYIPVGNKITIEHDSEYQPDVKVTYYQNAIGTEIEGLDTTDSFGGGTIYNVLTQLSFDRKKVHVEMPQKYTISANDYIIKDKNTLVIIDGNETLCFTMPSATILKAYVDGQ